jgi:hypothetical protein
VTLVPIGEGLAASVIAAFIFAAWMAIGSLFLSKLDASDEVTAPGAILIGSGITSFLLAIAAAADLVQSGVLIVAVLSAIVLFIRWRTVIRLTLGILEPYIGLARHAAVLVTALALGAILWAAAISPPRSADAMRYHLAHIRQIVQDGGWQNIADFHYALPFGWSLSYLPFELIGLPQGSQVLGLILFVVLISTMVRVFKWAGATRAALLIGLLLMLHPASLRVFTEANADSYALFAIFAISVFILRLSSLNSREAALFGFVSWIGLQSRYQLVAAGVAGLIVFLIAMRRHPARMGALFAYAGGSLVAIVLASPFYIANLRWFGNPVWPLMIDPSAPGATYADTVAYTYSDSLSGSHTMAHYIEGLTNLFTVPYLFPLSIVIVLSILVATVRRGREIRALGMFGAIFLIEWALMQPLLYPRFILMMAPVAALCAGFLLSKVLQERDRLERVALIAASVAAVALVVVAGAVNRESLRFAASGNEREYHRHTWFYRVYDWANRNTPADSRFLVIVGSGHSYYLDRPYRRGDPWISGVISWPNTNTGARLDSALAAGRYTHVIYENRNWKDYPGGAATMNAIGEASRSGTLEKIASFEDTLYTSRFGRMYRTTRVYVLRRINEGIF